MSETIRLIAADAAEAFLETVPAASTRKSLGSGDLATWELRGRLVGTLGAEPSIDLDGGERLDGAGGDACWVVGASPGCAGPTWEELTGRLAAALRDELGAVELSAAEAAAAWTRSGLPVDETRVEIRARITLRLRGGEVAPVVRAERGAEARLRWQAPEGPRTMTLALGDAPRVPAPRAGEGPRTFATLEAGDYPVILAPEAAAYFLHELAHAALERGAVPGAVPPAAGPALVEDPASAPFPYGFESDDLGHPAACSTLWSSAGRHALPAGHARRSTLAATPRPALSYTRLVNATIVPNQHPGLSLRADAVSAARYDPALDRIYLALSRLDLVDERGDLRHVAGGVLTVSADEAWQGLGAVDGEGRHRVVQARCTRLGCVHPVMVGAPTIALRSMQYVPGFPRWERKGA